MVFIDTCNEYEYDYVVGILDKHLEQSGVYSRIKPGTRVGLKLNLVSAMKPETAGTTHPVVVEALAKLLIDRGAEVIMGDSPGGPFNSAYLKTVYHICGFDKVAERTGAILNNDFTQRDVSFLEGVIARDITVTSWLLNVDIIINCAKLKTHGMLGMSAAVKNMFGSIPGTMKPEYHFRFPKQTDFANMLIDLQEFWKTKMALHVVDGIVGMEGNGPTAGTPRKVGVLLSGTDPYECDLICGRIIGLEQENILTMSEAYVRGLGLKSADEVDIKISPSDEVLKGTKDNCASLIIPDYGLLDKRTDLQFGGGSLLNRLVSKILAALLASKPEVDSSECVGCRKCEQICPAGAITMEADGQSSCKKPKIDRSKCIKCFCCQEFCPKGAMKVKRKPIAKLLAH